MRMVARRVLVVSATTMLVAASATAAAQAEKGLRNGEWIWRMTETAGAAPQRSRIAPKPDRFEYFQSGHVDIVASAIARRPPVPDVASQTPRDARMEGAELALVAGAKMKAARIRSIDLPLACAGDGSMAFRADRSDGGRTAPGSAAEFAFDQPACSPGRLVTAGRTRGAMEIKPELPQAERRAPAPVVIKFEAIVINISFSGLGG